MRRYPRPEDMEKMFSSLKLGRIFGIDLYAHGTFWLLPLFVFLSGVVSTGFASATFEVGVILAIFGCVALHEVGHALAARYYGVHTRDITLYPIGGVASLERMPERPWHEIVISLAGPAVNVVIALGILVGVWARSYVLPVGWSSAEFGVTEAFLGRLFIANAFLAVFNLIPAFPMDGGRVLRALLSFGLPRLDATRAAVGVGSVVAAGLFMIGLVGLPALGVSGFNLSLMLVAGVVFVLGQAELAAVRAQEARKLWRRRSAEFLAGTPYADAVQPDDHFTGWRYDPARRVWSEWRDGVLLREVHLA